MMIPFSVATGGRVWLDPQKIVRIYEIEREDAPSTSEIKMADGDKYEVLGHVGARVRRVLKELSKEPWQQ